MCHIQRHFHYIITPKGEVTFNPSSPAEFVEAWAITKQVAFDIRDRILASNFRTVRVDNGFGEHCFYHLETLPSGDTLITT